jgi:hypothetical protein
MTFGVTVAPRGLWWVVDNIQDHQTLKLSPSQYLQHAMGLHPDIEYHALPTSECFFTTRLKDEQANSHPSYGISRSNVKPENKDRK